MRASQLISMLNNLIEEHGDCRVWMIDDEAGNIKYYDAEYLEESDCCNAPINFEDTICSKCGEYCNLVEEHPEMFYIK